jgi:serine-type D-Ala-D-Ala carboxypeptidase (penicillin-binding protein 5/6)
LRVVKLRLLAATGVALALAAPTLASPPRPDARAWLVQNPATGEVLLSEHARDRLPIASITKLMTVLVTLEHARADDVVTVAPEAAEVGESTIDLRAGEQVRVGDLVEAALIQSANDAAWALALHVGEGSAERFVALMNAKATELGLTDTHFVRPDGLDAPGHVSSARDVTKLARVAMRNPLVREVVARRTDVAAGRTVTTWNDLLSTFPGLIGVKTGHTDGAGWSQVAAARWPGVTIYATILGSPTRSERNDDLSGLLSWGLSRYRRVPLVEGRRVYASVQTDFGRGPVELVAAGPLRRTVRIDRPLVERVVAPAGVSLPVEKGDPLGEVQVWAGRRLVGSRPLVAAETVTRPGLLGRIGWYSGRALDNAWGLVT